MKKILKIRKEEMMRKIAMSDDYRNYMNLRSQYMV